MKVRELFKHTAIYGLGDISRRLVGFVLIPIYTKYLSPGEYGIFQLSMTFISFGSLLYLLGVNTAFFRFYLDNKDEKERKRTFTTSFLFIFAVDVALTIPLVLARGWISNLLFGSPGHGLVVVLAGVALIAQSLETFPVLILRADNRSLFYLVMVIVQLATTLSSSAYFIVRAGMASEGALLGVVLGYVAIFLMFLPTAVAKLIPSFSWKLVRDLLSFGMPFVPSMLALTAVNISDQYVIRYFRGIEETGLYALGYKIGMTVNLFVSAFRMAYVPFLFQIAKAPDARERYSRAFTYFSSVLILATLLLCLGLDEIYELTVDPKFQASKSIVPVVAFSYVFFGIHTVSIVGIYLKERTSLMPLICGASAVCNVGANILLVPRYGMHAAAWTTFASFTLMAALTWYFSDRLYHVPYRLGSFAAALVLAAAAVWASTRLPHGSIILAISLKLLLFAAIAFVFVRFGLLPLRLAQLLPSRGGPGSTR
jgi:O-antigen/teichoic acid export membrane protein